MAVMRATRMRAGTRRHVVWIRDWPFRLRHDQVVTSGAGNRIG